MTEHHGRWHRAAAPVVTGDLNVESSTSITDRLAGPSSATLTGYYIKLP